MLFDRYLAKNLLNLCIKKYSGKVHIFFSNYLLLNKPIFTWFTIVIFVKFFDLTDLIDIVVSYFDHEVFQYCNYGNKIDIQSHNDLANLLPGLDYTQNKIDILIKNDLVNLSPI